MQEKALSIAFAVSLPLTFAGCTQEPVVSYKKDVQPILSKHCSECHVDNGAGIEASGFKTESYETLMQGTKFGPVIVPGDSLSSSLYLLVSGKVDKSIQMPHGREPLSKEETAAIERWINQGAKNN